MKRDDIVDFLVRYATSFDAPVREHTTVSSIRRMPDGRFEVEAGGEIWICSDLILATGAYQKPYRPSAASTVPSQILQIDVLDFSRPDDLPQGGILIVGNGQSGRRVTGSKDCIY